MSESGMVLYGVPRVEYGAQGCTPWPMCLRACAYYLGEDIPHCYTMAASGAAFRLTWDTEGWNAGNVDVLHTFDSALEVLRRGVCSLGREFRVIGRDSRLTRNDPDKFAGIPQTRSKDEFKAFITGEISKGYPCIALGIIGPPEACVITGYRDGGDTLLGWNFFQAFPEYAGGIGFDPSGYFITSKWWDDPADQTVAAIAFGPAVSGKYTLLEVLRGAVEVMAPRVSGRYAKGALAYDAWARMTGDSREFSRGMIMPLLRERYICQNDAMDCLQDGRDCAARFLRGLGGLAPELAGLIDKAAAGFERVVKAVARMRSVLGGYGFGEETITHYALEKTRAEITGLIMDAKAADTSALDALTKAVRMLE